MLELRVLSGIHRGAVLQLNEAHQKDYSIGSYDYADMLLLDAGIQSNHLHIHYEQDTWFLTAKATTLSVDAQFLTIDEKIPLQAYQHFYLAGIWLGSAYEHDAWDVLEPLPSLDTQNLNNLQQNQSYVDYNDADVSESESESADQNLHTQAIVMQDHKFSLKSKIFGVLGLLMLTGFATANVFFTDTKTKPVETSQENTQPTQIKFEKQYYSREEMATILEQKILESEFSKHVNVNYNVDGWIINSSLTDEDKPRLEKIIETFNQTYKPRFPIDVRYVKLENLLGIKITQVISGKLAGVVLEDDTRLYIGDEIKGYKLISVSGNKVVFQGEQTIEIKL
jgi:type III secretion protein D